jgi:hypothetical protein
MKISTASSPNGVRQNKTLSARSGIMRHQHRHSARRWQHHGARRQHRCAWWRGVKNSVMPGGAWPAAGAGAAAKRAIARAGISVLLSVAALARWRQRGGVAQQPASRQAAKTLAVAFGASASSSARQRRHSAAAARVNCNRRSSIA